MYRVVYTYSTARMVLLIGAAIYLVIFHPPSILFLRSLTLHLWASRFTDWRIVKNKERRGGAGWRERRRSLLAIGLKDASIACLVMCLPRGRLGKSRNVRGTRRRKCQRVKVTKRVYFYPDLSYNRNYWRIVRKIRLFTENDFHVAVSKSSIVRSLKTKICFWWKWIFFFSIEKHGTQRGDKRILARLAGSITTLYTYIYLYLKIWTNEIYLYPFAFELWYIYILEDFWVFFPLFHELRIVEENKHGGGSSFSLEEKKSRKRRGGGELCDERLFWVFRWWLYKTVLCRGIKEADIKASVDLPRFQRWLCEYRAACVEMFLTRLIKFHRRFIHRRWLYCRHDPVLLSRRYKDKQTMMTGVFYWSNTRRNLSFLNIYIYICVCLLIQS